MKKVLLLASFFTLTPILLTFCLIYLSFLSLEKNKQSASIAPVETIAYAAVSEPETAVLGVTTKADPRVESVRAFFQKYHSPLEPYAEDVVRLADRYEIDYKLIPAIGMQESHLCLKAPQSSRNCWGYGIYGKQVISFDSYPEAIEAVTKSLAINYVGIGLETPEEIMTKYTPSSNGSWAVSIRHFMDEIN